LTAVLPLLPSFQIHSDLQSASRIYCPAGYFSSVFSPPATRGEALRARFFNSAKGKAEGNLTPVFSHLLGGTEKAEAGCFRDAQGKEERQWALVASRLEQAAGRGCAVSILEKFKVNWRVP